ncbi:MAG TPA: site-2 protease family protein [Candidatus Saccharimonadales bacterium]|nr:site-2 protease family protein [Candidatus Saccharimonadales bacterium]
MLTGLGVTGTIIVIVSIIISIAIHEAMHGFAAHALGDDTAKEAGRLTLNPLKHIDPYTTVLLPIVMVLIFHVPFLAAKPVPFNPNRVKFREYGAALVGLAGPLSNFVLAGLAAVILRVFASRVSVSLDLDIFYFMYINVAIFVFNMIPFPPLDGSRLLYAFAPEPLQRVMQRIEGMGFVAILFIILLFFAFLSPFIISIDQHLVNFLVG